VPAVGLLYVPEWLSGTASNTCRVVLYLWHCALCRANTQRMWHLGTPKLYIKLGTKKLVFWRGLV